MIQGMDQRAIEGSIMELSIDQGVIEGAMDQRAIVAIEGTMDHTAVGEEMDQ